MNRHGPALVVALSLAGALFVPLVFSGLALGAPLRANGSASPTTIDETQSVSFACTPNGGTLPYAYSWAFGDGGTSTLQNPSYAYNTAGAYLATVVVTDGVGATDSWTSPAITVNPLPTVAGSAAPTTIDVNQSISFTCTPSNGTAPYTYSWNFSDGSPDLTAQNPSHLYISAGTYAANVTVTDAVGAQANWSVAIRVNPMSTVTGSAAPTTIDANQTVQFACTPSYGTTPYAYSWTFGDGGTSTLQNPSHIYGSQGSYTANVTLTDGVGGLANWTVNITVNALPTVSGTATPTNIHPGQVVSFTCTPSFGTTPYTYSWDFGTAPGQLMDGSTNQSQSPFYEYRNSGPSSATHTATVTITDAVGEQASWTSPAIAVDAQPALVVTPFPAAIDMGQSMSFTCNATFGSGAYTSYFWTFGDGSFSNTTGRNATHEYDSEGSYSVVVVVTDSLGDRAIQRLNVTVNVLPYAIVIVSPDIVKTGKIVSFTCSPSGGTVPYTYMWTFGDGSTSTDQSPDHEYAMEGTYSVNLTMTDATNQTVTWRTVITVSSSESGVSLILVALMVAAPVVALAIILLLVAAKRKKRPRTLVVKSLASEDPPPPPVSLPKIPAPVVEHPPLKEVRPVIEPPKDSLKSRTRQSGKVCPLCLSMNDPAETVCKLCGTKLK